MTNFHPRLHPSALASLALVLALAGCQPAAPPERDVAGPPAAPTRLTALAPDRVGERADPSDFCSLDTVDGALFTLDPPTTLAHPESARISGWVGDRSTLARPDAPVLRVNSADGTRAWEIWLGAPKSRGDVVRHYDAPGMQQSGFDAVFDLSALPPGEYRLSLAYQSSGRQVRCDQGRRVIVDG